MATQVRRMSVPMPVQNQSSGGIFTQLMRLIIQPRTFFKAMPSNHQWLLVAILVLVITGFTATTQIQSSSTSSASTTTSQTTAFSLNTLSQTSTTQTTQPSAAATTTANSGSTSANTNTTANTNANTTNNAAAATTSSTTTFMNALLAACGVIAVWAGEAILLSLVCMLRGYAPKIGKSLQIAVWASLPLALMLVLRYAYYANGGSGGSLGISLLLDSWRGYSSLPQFAQRALAVFTSNLTLFWVWNIMLLFLGARYALGGGRLMSVFVVVMWIIASTLIPAYFGTPTTRAAPRPTTTTQTNTTSTTNTTRSNSATTATQTSPQSGTAGGFGGFGGSGGSGNGGGFGGPPGG